MCDPDFITVIIFGVTSTCDRPTDLPHSPARAQSDGGPGCVSVAAATRACVLAPSATNNARATIKRDCPVDDDIGYGANTPVQQIFRNDGLLPPACASPSLRLPHLFPCGIISWDFRMVLITFRRSMQTWRMAH